MKNTTWRHGLLLALAFWSGASQASTLSTSSDIQIYSGGKLALQANPTPISLVTTRPSLTAGGSIQISSGGSIEIQSGQPPINSGVISSAAVMPLPTEPTIWAVNWTSGSITHIGDYFDVNVFAVVPLDNASPDELILGFGFNALLSGNGSAQFLGRTVNTLFDDISTQDGVNLTSAGLAFPGLGSNEVGSMISLAILHFQATAVGDLNIAITGDLSDPNQGLIYLNQAPLAIRANTLLAITAVPLPPSVLMFLGGLAISARGLRKHH